MEIVFVGEILNLGVDIVLSLDNVAQIVFVLLLFSQVFLLAHDRQVFFFVDFVFCMGVSFKCVFDGKEVLCMRREMRGGKGG